MPWISNFEMATLTGYGMPGVWTHGYVDEWSPGYVGFMSTNHNGLFKMYETFGNGGATTELRHVKPVDGPGEDLHAGDQTGRDPKGANWRAFWSLVKPAALDFAPASAGEYNSISLSSSSA